MIARAAHTIRICLGIIACDIALLPPMEMMEGSIQLNRRLLRSFEPKIVLDRRDRLPHLSLAMGGLREEELPAAAALIEEIGSQFPPIPLIFTGIHTGVIGTGETVSTLRTEQTPLLRSLHETVMSRFEALLSHHATAEGFIGFPEVEAASVEWVDRYRNAAAFEQFSPHITLGIGELPPEALLPPDGAALRLALCHLGNYCTCRKVLFETTLRGREKEG